MFTFTTILSASGTLIVSGIAGKVLSHYGKSDLAETLHSITYLSAYGYGLYISYKVVSLAAKVFLGIFV
jgi:hypothetical protein